MTPNTFLPNNTKRSWQKSRPFANHDGAFCRAGSGSVSFAG